MSSGKGEGELGKGTLQTLSKGGPQISQSSVFLESITISGKPSNIVRNMLACQAAFMGLLFLSILVSLSGPQTYVLPELGFFYIKAKKPSQTKLLRRQPIRVLKYPRSEGLQCLLVQVSKHYDPQAGLLVL